jgi:hypothetical protein
MMDRKQMMQIIDEFCPSILPGFVVSIKPGYFDMAALAEIAIDELEKDAVIKLSYKFRSCDDNHKRNILIHELVHARFEYYQRILKITKKHKAYDVEEQLINDYTRAIELRI